MRLRNLASAPSADPTSARLRQARLLRAALATGVMVMLAAGLVLFDAREADVAAVTPQPAPAGAETVSAADFRSAAVSDATPPDAAASPGSVPPAAASQSGATASPALPSAEGEPLPPAAAAPTGGPPPEAAATSAATDIASAPAPVGTPADTPAAHAAAPVSELPATSAQATDAAATPTTAPAPIAGSPPSGPGFMVQLGVFTDSANAESLRRELARKGYPAHLQSRVVLGPFPNRQAALAAQEKVRRERKLDGMILPPRKP